MSHTNCTRPDGNIGCIDCVAYGAEERQDEIIKQLEETKATFLGTAQDYVAPGLDLAIALIKGENK